MPTQPSSLSSHRILRHKALSRIPPKSKTLSVFSFNGDHEGHQGGCVTPFSGSSIPRIGTFLRTTLTYCILFGPPLILKDIRLTGTPHPGLRPDEVELVNAVCKLTGSVAIGNNPHSTVLEFYPYGRGGWLRESGPISSVSLDLEGPMIPALQGLLPIVLFSRLGGAHGRTGISPELVTVYITGLPYAPNAPSVRYFLTTMMPVFASIGLAANIVPLSYSEAGLLFPVKEIGGRGQMVVNVYPLRAALPAFTIKEPVDMWMRSVIVVYATLAKGFSVIIRGKEEVLCDASDPDHALSAAKAPIRAGLFPRIRYEWGPAGYGCQGLAVNELQEFCYYGFTTRLGWLMRQGK